MTGDKLTGQGIPVFLLKTRSGAADAYAKYFSINTNGKYSPSFVPVLEHHFNANALRTLHSLVVNGAFNLGEKFIDERCKKYGGIIFTSQRAVEAFSEIVETIRRNKTCVSPFLPDQLPLYVVGPATARTLRALQLSCQIVGEETGNGQVLAAFMLSHYNDLQRKQSQPKPPLLFLVGEQRRDIIPKALQSELLPSDEKIQVDEMTIYETGVMESFADDFSKLVEPNISKGLPQWVVVFSPTGCKAMLDTLGFLDERTGKVNANVNSDDRNTRIVTIGPTTRDYLIRGFDFAPDVCAEKPSPEGVGAAIEEFETRRRVR